MLSDGGLCCIDEFDKMGGEKQVLLEAMEQQTVSIAKAGIVCTLSSRVSILAAANPSGGHYNRGKTVSENIKMPPGLLSRFDLVFPAFFLRAHHENVRSRRRIRRFPRSHLVSTFLLFDSSAAPSFSMQDDSSISLRLRRGAAEVTDPIPAVLLRKYLAFVHQTVNPRLTSDAARVLKSFYLSLRDQYGDDEAIPITMRHLESLVRLSQARARLECRSEVSVEDAKDIIEIMKESLFEVLSDEMGMVDFQRTTGMSKTKQVKLFVAALTKEAERRSNALFSVRVGDWKACEVGNDGGGKSESHFCGGFYGFCGCVESTSVYFKERRADVSSADKSLFTNEITNNGMCFNIPNKIQPA